MCDVKSIGLGLGIRSGDIATAESEHQRYYVSAKELL